MGAVFGLAASDDRLDAALPEEAAVLVVVVAAIGKQAARTPSRPTRTTTHRRDSFDKLEELGDVVAVGSCQRPGKRQPAAVYEEVVLAAAPAAIDRTWTCFRAPFFACR